ncbi:MAG: TIGR00725 family protein [Thermoplasma sp.]|nr:MAG: TIGR00725 family protein [Thermoplasma sp.]
MIGGSRVHDDVCEVAYNVGRILAQRGVIVICGGLTGVMECASHGVRDGGGTVVGILPGYDASEANRYISIPLPTGMGYMRNFLIIRASQAIIAIDGSAGTLSEASFAISEGKDVVSIYPLNIPRTKEKEGHVYVEPDPQKAVDLAISLGEKWQQIDESNER